MPVVQPCSAAAWRSWEHRRLNVYDCLGFGPYWEMDQQCPSRRLFGNRNIGQLDRCNLQVPGQITFDDTSAFLENWYARSDATEADLPVLEWAAHHTIVTLVIGDKPMWLKSLFDLLRAKPWVPPSRHLQPVTEEEEADRRWRHKHRAHTLRVPPRQFVSAHVEFFEDAQRDLVGIAPLTIWLHLEGDLRGASFQSRHDLTPVEWMERAAHDDQVAMAEVASWDPDLRQAVRDRFHEQRRHDLAWMVRRSDREHEQRRPRVGTMPDDDIDDTVGGFAPAGAGGLPIAIVR
jgi:hypothetical protein